DGVPVSPEIGFALDEEDKDVKTVPSSKPGFYVNDNLRGLIESFVIEYFTQYDGPDPE
uniref:Uncharacterized protein n=1 Tax=Plectus sambesii TaxID=2011161 RepID=A0A914VAT4_9BILA